MVHRGLEDVGPTRAVQQSPTRPEKTKIRLSSETTSLIGLILARMLRSLMHEPNLESKSGVCLHSPFQGVWEMWDFQVVHAQG